MFGMCNLIETLELEDNIFNNNLLEVASEEAMRPPDPNTNLVLWELMENMEEQLQQGNYLSERRPDRNKGTTDQNCYHGDTKQSPPNIEPAQRPPRE